MMATYRPHNNPLMEWVQTRGRMRSNKAMTAEIPGAAIIVGALKKGKPFGLLPTRLRPQLAAFAPFFRG